MDPPDILFWCCSRQLWCLNWKRPGAVSVEFSMARQWGDTAILSIFFWYWYGFLFQCRVFPAYNFLHYQYKSTNNLHLHLQDAADVEPFVVRKVSDHNNEQLNLREVGKLLRGKENKGELFSVHPSFNSWLWPKTHWFYTQLICQPSLLKQSTLHMSLQPKQSRPSSSTRTALWMWKLQKTRRMWKQSLFGFGHPKQHVCPSSSGQWIGLQNILTHRYLLNFLTLR